MKRFDQLTTQLDPSVPDLSPGIAKLLTILSSDDVEIAELARELELYPVVVARLISLANSAWSSSAGTVSDLASACIRLGPGVVKSSAIGYVVASPFDPLRCKSFDPNRFWCCSLLAAEAADYLAERRGVDASLARSGGMLRNLGLVWLADALPAATNNALTLLANDNTLDVASALSTTVGASHLQASHHLFKAWGFPDELLDACDSESTSPLATLCRLSSNAATDVFTGADPCAEQAECSSSEAANVKAHIEKFAEKISSIARSIA